MARGCGLEESKELGELCFEDEVYFDHYQGDVLNGLRDGNGTFSFADGSFYSGMWRDNKPCGVGIFHYTDGKYDAGIYSVRLQSKSRKGFWTATDGRSTPTTTYT